MSDVAALNEAEELLAEVDSDRRRFPRYPTYRESDSKWLLDIPAHWGIRRLRFVAAINPTKSEIAGLLADDLVSFVPMEAVNEFGGVQLDQTRPLETVTQGYTYFRNGDIVIAKITPCFENGKGSIADQLVNGIGFGTTELHVVRPIPSKLDRQYLFYVTMSQQFRSLGTGEMYGAGGQKRVPDSFIKDFRTPLPPLDEQRAIARFLDRETAKIDSLVAKKRRLIELLQEKRTALISRAVTKGLTPDAPMKPSGIVWLGDVPAHWEISRLKFSVSKIGSGKTPKGGSQVYVTAGVMLLRSQNIYDDGLRLDDVVFITEATDDEMSGTRVKPGDVLLNITGASIGRCGLVPQEFPSANVNQHVCIIRPRTMRSAFLHAVLCSKGIKDWISAEENGTSREGLNFRQVGNIALPMPPSEEQGYIMQTLREKTAQIDGLVARVQSVIDRLVEYRSALVSAAVTGQIDVRGEMPR